MFDKITKKNWLFYAIKNYNVPNLDSEQEFYEDVKRFKYLKRLFRKYRTTGELKTRLVLNHIIVLTNVFGNEAAATLLLFKIEREITDKKRNLKDFTSTRLYKLQFST